MRKRCLSRSPDNCVNNKKKRIHGVGSVGICMDTSKTSLFDQIFVCDNQQTCDECPIYKCRHTEESVNEDFNHIINDVSLCGKEFPKIAMIRWILDDSSIPAMPSKWSRIKRFLHGK